MSYKNHSLDFHYFVDEEKRTVVCKVKMDMYDPQTEFNHMLVKNNVVDQFFSEILDVHAPMYIEFVGKAKCLEEDTFDVEVGKEIAKKKALYKLNEYKLDILNEYYNALMDTLGNISWALSYYDDKLIRLEDDLGRYYEVEEE